MNILVLTLNFPPKRFIGAELYDLAFIKALQKSGHKVYVKTVEHTEQYEYDGISVNEPYKNEELNLIITHLELRQKAHYERRLSGKKIPIIGIQHNFNEAAVQASKLYSWEGIVFNSSYMSKNSPSLCKNTFVLIPPCPKPQEKVNTKASKILFVNLSPFKGAENFWKIAEQAPEQNFIAVKGGWGNQYIPEKIPSNVELLDHQEDLSKVYKESKSVLILSWSESWCMVASEAQAYGANVLAWDFLPGVAENIGKPGHILDNLKGIKQITPLLKGKQRLANLTQAQKNFVRHQKELKNFVKFCEELAG